MEDTYKIATSNKTDPSKYYTNFLYKAAIVSIFLLILPILPSQAPEIVTQYRSWELLQVLFVGLAVSYGLFSRKNDKTEHEKGTNFDNAHTYLSRFLQLSSVFDEESEFPTETEERKVHTWNNRYRREEPVLVVAEKNSVIEKQSRVNPVSAEKPLLLPIRSLKSRLYEPDITIDSSEKNISYTRSNSSSSSNSCSKSFHSDFGNYGNGEVHEFSSVDSGTKSEENVVLRSPIPWRSRSGRMEMRENIESLPLISLESETEHSDSEPLENPFLRPHLAQPPKPNSKNIENLARKKIYHKTESKPMFSFDSETEYSDLQPLGKPSSRPQFTNQLKPNSKIVEDLARNKMYRNTRTPPPAPPPPPPSRHHQKPPLGKSSFVPVKEAKMKEIEELESDEEIESDEETEDEHIKGEKEEEIVENGGSNLGPDVNKKADEFIAKFREQIRLQRIETIKQIGRSSSR